MKITQIKTYLYFSTFRNLIIIRMDTDEGITGVGEATVRNKELAIREALDNHIGPQLTGASPFDIESMFNRFFTKDAWRNGVVYNSAISGLEMAMWDIMGKKLGMPVYNLIGGKMRDKIRLYANGWSRMYNDGSLNGYVRAAREISDMGFTALKWDPLKFAPDGCSQKTKIRMAIKCIEAVREAVGDEMDLLVELHGTLDYDGALELIRSIENLRPMLVEEPVHADDTEGYRKLSLKSNVPLAAGERAFTRWGYKEIFERGALSVIQPDISHMGGIFETKKTAAMAEAYFLKVAPHNSNGPVATMANIMLDATLPNFLIQEFFIENIHLNENILKMPFLMKDGYIILNDAPGLGIELDFDALGKGGYRQVYS